MSILSIFGNSGSSVGGNDTGLSLIAAGVAFVLGTGLCLASYCARNGGSSRCEDKML